MIRSARFKLCASLHPIGCIMLFDLGCGTLLVCLCLFTPIRCITLHRLFCIHKTKSLREMYSFTFALNSTCIITAIRRYLKWMNIERMKQENCLHQVHKFRVVDETIIPFMAIIKSFLLIQFSSNASKIHNVCWVWAHSRTIVTYGPQCNASHLVESQSSRLHSSQWQDQQCLVIDSIEH